MLVSICFSKMTLRDYTDEYSIGSSLIENCCLKAGKRGSYDSWVLSILSVNKKYPIFNIVYFLSISVCYIQNNLFISHYKFYA